MRLKLEKINILLIENWENRFEAGVYFSFNTYENLFLGGYFKL